MRRTLWVMMAAFYALILTGCSTDTKAADLSWLYGITAVVSALLLVSLFFIVKKKNRWYILLFVSVAVVNLGYFLLSISQTLSGALMSNRLAYFGSVFLPFAMYMIIRDVSGLPRKKWLQATLLGISILVFLIAASPGYLDLYYKEVTFQRVNGVCVLNKVYGPLHFLYLVYLLGYFCAMVTTIACSIARSRLENTGYAVILILAVFINIGVWLIEQLVRIDFEILSVSYIISECFLLGLYFMMTNQPKAVPVSPLPPEPLPEVCPVTAEQIELFQAGLPTLTPKERAILDCYVAGMPTVQVMETLNIKENTLKFHNKNLYSKLGVSSRKQLLLVHKHL
ncbi:MAG: hypothetical protein E7437_03700 [Ruminococcaceae bacterium]|nr:hypothetical protein [Oscillospiraceae bacterium]